MHRSKVRVVEDALDANDTIAAAHASDFERSGATVVNTMSARGAGKAAPLERSLESMASRPDRCEGAQPRPRSCHHDYDRHDHARAAGRDGVMQGRWV